MKKISKYIFHLFGLIIATALLVTSCEQEAMEDFNSVPAADVSDPSVSVDDYTDSTLTAAYDLGMPGRVTLALFETPVDTPSVAAMESRTVEALAVHYLKHGNENASGTATFEGLIPGREYVVYGIGHNTDGVVSNLVSTDPVSLEDTLAPVIEAYNPAHATGGSGALYSDGVPADRNIVLEFNEPIVYNDDASNITLGYYFAGGSYNVPTDSVSVEGNKLIIKHEEFPYYDFIDVLIDAGAIEDQYGNAFEGLVMDDYWFGVGPNPEHVLGNIFGEFSGEYEVIEYAADSTSELARDTFELAQSVDGDKKMLHIETMENFWGVAVSFNAELKEDGYKKYVYLGEYPQETGLVGDQFGGSLEGKGPLYVKSGAPQDAFADGHWYYTDFSFDMRVTFLFDDGTVMYDGFLEFIPINGSKQGHRFPMRK